MNNSDPKILWQPSARLISSSNLGRFARWLHVHRRGPYQNVETEYLPNYELLRQWSVDDPADFWETLWGYLGIKSYAPYRQVLSGTEMPGARWFEGAELNYAEHVFRNRSDKHPALLFQVEGGKLETISWQSLESETAALAHWLRMCGIRPGDRVAAYLPNSPHAIIAALAALSVGAVWSSCSPDFGTSSVLDRFAQIEPKILFAVDGYTYNGKPFDKTQVVRELCAGLPSLEQVVFIPYLNPDARPEGLPAYQLWNELVSAPAPPLVFEPLPFDHPIWILYSSGTTGMPKAITHSHGGNLLEHLKYLVFHNDVRPGERFFWYTTTGWMMWNFTLGSMLAGATAVLFDGSPGYPSLDALWKLAEEAEINHFGGSAPFLISCMKAGLKPKSTYNLKKLRTIGSTGSPLPPEAFSWVYRQVKRTVWLSSMSGGTDVCTAWVGGNPLLPVYQGEIQCRCLGCAMESWSEDGQPVPPDEVGEMVVTKPMPSMPIYFWNDADGSKYKNSYFDTWPGVWRHGDWLRVTPRGTLVILGRSDATLNRQGVRIGTAEIYRALDAIGEIRDCLILNLEYADGTDWMPLFVAMQPGHELTPELIERIRKTLRAEYSPRHVPDTVILVPDIPYTISGKKMEMPVKKILQGRPLEKAFNRDSMKNPEAMDYFIEMAAGRKE